MKSIIILIMLILVLIVPVYPYACSTSKSGGSDYIPERRDNIDKQILDINEAQKIVTNYMKSLREGYTNGPIKDNGDFFEVELFLNNKVIQKLGIDKLTGRLFILETMTYGK